MAGEALQMVCVSQRSHELSCESLSTLAAYLPTALRLRWSELQVVGVCVGARGHVVAVVRVAVGGLSVVLVGPPPRKAVAARVVAVVLLRGVLALHVRRAIGWCAHVQWHQSRRLESIRCGGAWWWRAVAGPKQRVLRATAGRCLTVAGLQAAHTALLRRRAGSEQRRTRAATGRARRRRCGESWAGARSAVSVGCDGGRHQRRRGYVQAGRG
jgi:hypothetical protein